MATTATGPRNAIVPTRADEEQRLVVHGVTWKEYILLNDAIETPGLRMAYCDGVLEIMTVSAKHEGIKKFIARLIETWALECDVPLYGYGSTTFREEARSRGAEPDECWTVGADMKEFPQIVLEVVLTHGGIDKLELYRGMDVPEVWFWMEGKFHIYALSASRYEPVERSRALPQIDFAELTRLIGLGDQHAAVKELRDRLRRRSKRSSR